ncbi:MAG: M23 family metallopeptidase [Ginsengibacter sp.]
MKITLSKTYIIHKPFLFFLFTFLSFGAHSQVTPKRNYPKNYFIYPVQAKIGLAANFGELRPNHYHMGLDCRTDQAQNKNVLAAAEGYVARVKIEPFGFGRAIYINHPNGLTTLYAHLNEFYPELEEYVNAQQYELQSWEVYLDIPEKKFSVKKGQFIAKSGNTGGSQGPHCHFEIRDTRIEKVLNPLLFGLPIADDVPPTIIRLAMYDRCLSTYSQSPKLFSLKKLPSGYTTTLPVITFNTDKISFGISANDKVSGSSNPNGIYAATLYLDENPVSAFVLDSIGYNETRFLNAHIDYKTRAQGGPYIEHLSRLPGYPESVYRDITGNGVLEITDDSIHQVRIEVQDANGNTSNLNFKIKKGLIKENGRLTDSAKYYQQQEFHPGFVNIFESEAMQMMFSPGDLYDSVSFIQTVKQNNAANSYSDFFTAGSGLIPIHSYFITRIKANQDVPASLKDRMLMKRTWGSKTEIVKAVADGEWYTASFRELGNFELIADDEDPVIGGFSDNANLSKFSRIVFTPKDNQNEMKNFKAMLDGKWLKFTNDKGRSFIYNFDERCPRGYHELNVSIEDEAGNVANKIFHFIK